MAVIMYLATRRKVVSKFAMHHGQRGYRQRDIYTSFLLVASNWAALRREPRFAAALRSHTISRVGAQLDHMAHLRTQPCAGGQQTRPVPQHGQQRTR